MNTILYLHTKFLLPAVFLATAGAGNLAAQESRATTKPQEPVSAPTAMDFTTTSRMVGATVFLQAAAKDVVEARKEGDKVKHPEATVSEWLVDSRSGELCNAVVSFGGFLGIGDKTVLVPAKDLAWNNSMERYDLGWTVEELKAKPAFDLDAACKSGLDAACGHKEKVEGSQAKDVADASSSTGRVDRNQEKDPSDATLRTRKAVVGTEFIRPECCLAKASTIASAPVHAGSKEWGKVSDLIVDRKQNAIVLAIVNHGSTLGVGGDDYLVPFKGLTACQKNAKDETSVLCAEQRTSADLENGVRFEKPKNGVVDVEAAKRALGEKSATKKD